MEELLVRFLLLGVVLAYIGFCFCIVYTDKLKEEEKNVKRNQI